MMAAKTSSTNITNSQDPALVNCRVFIGNLNTPKIQKEEVERMFRRHGQVAGFSMHKGYAFVQYYNEFHARQAVAQEDGKMIAGQTIDVNIASEPKPRQKAFSKLVTGGGPASTTPNGAPMDWSGYYGFNHPMAPPVPVPQPPRPLFQQRLPGIMTQSRPPMKRPRLDSGTGGGMGNKAGGGGGGKPNRPKGQPGKTTENLMTVKTENVAAASSAIPINVGDDVLICGTCKSSFARLDDIVMHKRSPCQLKFHCKCGGKLEDGAPAVIWCAFCESKFTASWQLVKHVKDSHDLGIYRDSAEALVQIEGGSVSQGEGAAGAEVSGEGANGDGGVAGEVSGAAVVKDDVEGMAVGDPGEAEGLDPELL